MPPKMKTKIFKIKTIF